MQAQGYAVSPLPTASEMPDMERLKVAIHGLSRAVTSAQKESMLAQVLALLEPASEEFDDMSRLIEQQRQQILQYKPHKELLQLEVERLKSEVASLKSLSRGQAPPAPDSLTQKERETYEERIDQLNGEVDFFKQELEHTQRKLQSVLDRDRDSDRTSGFGPSAATQAARQAQRVVTGGLEAGYAAGKSLAGKIGAVGTEKDALKGNIYAGSVGAASIYDQPPPPPPPDTVYSRGGSIYDDARDAKRGPPVGLQEQAPYRNVYEEHRGSGIAATRGAVSYVSGEQPAVASKIWVMRHAGMLVGLRVQEFRSLGSGSCGTRV